MTKTVKIVATSVIVLPIECLRHTGYKQLLDGMGK